MTDNLISTNVMSRLIDWERHFLRDLGVAASEVVTYRAERKKDFVRRITDLVSGGFRTVVYLDLGCKHAVGLVPLGDGTYRTISTWDPFRDNASTTARCIFPLLEQMQPQTVHYGSVMMIEKAANIRAFPPERPI